MKVSESSSVYETIRKCYSVYAKPKLIAEWNYNRLRPTWTGNEPNESRYNQDIEYFPHESMARGWRPGRGIIKARVGEGRIAWDYFDDPNSQFRSHGEGQRYYVADVTDMYKYWSSPAPSNASGNWPDHTNGTKLTAWPWVEYDKSVRANKIVIGLENTWSSPLNYTIWVENPRAVTDDPPGSWEQIASQSNTTIDSNGRITLYYDGSWFGVDESNAQRKSNGPRVQAARALGDIPHGTGSPSTDFGPFDNIVGVQLRVSQMDKPDAYLNVIEIAACLERDLSSEMISVEDTFEMSDYSQTHPIGKASSNLASVSLGNVCHLFNNDRTQSQFYNMLFGNVRMNLSYVFETLSGSSEEVQQFEMFSEVWSGQTEDTVTLDLRDASKYLQEIRPRRVMYENYTVAEIVWSICDSIGWSKYHIDRVDNDHEHSIDIFWTDREKTAWEIFTELSEHTQTAIFFDAWGVLQVKTAKAAFNESSNPVWQLYGNSPTESKLADIVTLEKTNQYESNYITVSYQTTKWPQWNRGFPVREIVWEPNQENSPEAGDTGDDRDSNLREDNTDGSRIDRYGQSADKTRTGIDDSRNSSNDDERSTTVTLRATPLQRQLDRGDTFLWIEPREARHWPYEGHVNIEGEFIKYDGKQYKYYTGINTHHTTTVNSQWELRQARNKTPAGLRHKNRFTGGLRITKRGLWNSEPKRHFLDARGWNAHNYRNGNRHVNAKGFRHFKKLSKVRIHTSKRWGGDDILLATRGESDDAGYYHYGTHMRVMRNTGSAGFVIHNQGAKEDGYYIDLTTTKNLEGKQGNSRGELVVYARNDGVMKKLGSANCTILKNKWFYVDIDFKKDVGAGNDHILEVSVNGFTLFNKYITGGDKVLWGGKFGMFVRGNNFAEWDYVYAVNREEGPRSDESEFFFDRIEGGYQSQQWDREWIFATRLRKNDKLTKRDNDKDREKFKGRFFDEFGPIVHEMRVFNVWFEPYPVKVPNIFVSNDNQIFCPEFRADNFTADFILTNATRKNAIANGGDSASFAGEQVNQRLLIFGQVPIIKSPQSVVAANEESIQREGRIETEIASPWIQNKNDAEKLATWIRDHWAGTADELTVTIFGNPLLEIGDVVEVESQQHDLFAAKHRYFVTSTSNAFQEGGLETTLVLRRVRPSWGELT